MYPKDGFGKSLSLHTITQKGMIIEIINGGESYFVSNRIDGRTHDGAQEFWAGELRPMTFILIDPDQEKVNGAAKIYDSDTRKITLNDSGPVAPNKFALVADPAQIGKGALGIHSGVRINVVLSDIDRIMNKNNGECFILADENNIPLMEDNKVILRL